MLGAALAAGGLGIAGNIVQGLMARKSQDRQMAFQKDMSNTSHQREVADLRAAGLNPILSANSGASSPPGAGMDIPNVGDTAQAAVSSALQSKKLSQEKAIQHYQKSSMITQQVKDMAATDLLTKELETETANARMKNAEADIKETIANFVRKHPDLTNWLSTLAPLIQPAAGVAQKFIPSR
ncbi:MAG: DNA pilot protein [Microvirus sp.]|nr:MAG: DNA pilot protein [Microvirus sp.]